MSKEIATKFENQLSKYYLQTIQDLLEEQEINPHQFLHNRNLLSLLHYHIHLYLNHY